MAWYCLLREVEQRSGCLGIERECSWEHLPNEENWRGVVIAAVEAQKSPLSGGTLFSSNVALL